MQRHSVSIIGSLLSIGLAGGMTTGCAGGGGSAIIQVPADQRHNLTGDSSTLVRLPEERPFNIHLKNSSQNPGPSGSARGRSDATPEGIAHAGAEASEGGQAAAEFTLGHRVNHQADVPHQVTIEAEFLLEQTLQASEPPAPGTRGSATLQLIVQNEKRQQVALLPLFQTDSDNARASGSSSEKRSLVVRFEPQMSYDVYLFGRVNAATAEDQAATAELKVTDLKLRFQVSPADPKPDAQARTAAADARGG